VGSTANLAVFGGNLLPKSKRGSSSPLAAPRIASRGGLVARQHGPVARATLPADLSFRVKFQFLGRFFVTSRPKRLSSPVHGDVSPHDERTFPSNGYENLYCCSEKFAQA
jgi:hypothetical protein